MSKDEIAERDRIEIAEIYEILQRELRVRRSAYLYLIGFVALIMFVASASLAV